jgi:hypothetical protein
MAKSFRIVFISVLMAAVFWLVPNLDRFATAIELPEDLQNLLNQAATDLNFPYPAPTDQDPAEEPPEIIAPALDSRASLNAPALNAPRLKAPSPASEVQKGEPIPQHLD